MTVTSAKHGISAREISTIAIFIALTAVMAQIAVPIPFSPVPIAFGLVAVYMTGMLLRPRPAVLAQLGYLLLGAIGIPVFSNFKGGIMALFGPTGGYLMVYPLMAAIVSMALNGRRTAARSGVSMYVKATASICLAHLLLYVGGTCWFSVTTGTTFGAALALAVYPFVPLDLVKIAFCVVAILPFRNRLIALRLLPLNDSGAHQ